MEPHHCILLLQEVFDFTFMFIGFTSVLIGMYIEMWDAIGV